MTKTKTTLIFIGLKIAEVIGVVLLLSLFWYVGGYVLPTITFCFNTTTIYIDCNSIAMDYIIRIMIGFFFSVIGVFSLWVIGYIFYNLAKMNWEWAEDIEKRFRK